MYETKIKTALWWAYDIPGNIGWILYFIGYGKFTAKGGFTAHLSAGLLLAVPALLMLIGIIELVSERIHKLDRKLPAVRFWRGSAVPYHGENCSGQAHGFRSLSEWYCRNAVS